MTSLSSMSCVKGSRQRRHRRKQELASNLIQSLCQRRCNTRNLSKVICFRQKAERKKSLSCVRVGGWLSPLGVAGAAAAAAKKSALKAFQRRKHLKCWHPTAYKMSLNIFTGMSTMKMAALHTSVLNGEFKQFFQGKCCCWIFVLFGKEWNEKNHQPATAVRVIFSQHK